MNGACYSNEHQISENRDFTEKLLPLTTNSIRQYLTFIQGWNYSSDLIFFLHIGNHLRQIVGEIYDYAFGQAGFSVHVTVKNATNVRVTLKNLRKYYVYIKYGY